MENFLWRVSMARVERDGAFSVFPGIDRTLCLLEGAGLTLNFGAGQAEQHVDMHSAPLRFAADIPVTASLTNGAILDLNVMTRRGQFDHLVHCAEAGAVPPIEAHGLERLVLVSGGAAFIQAAAGSFRLEDKDCVVMGAQQPAQLELEAGARCYTVTLILCGG